MGGGVRLWEVSEPGRVSFPEGLTRFEPDPAGPHRYLIPAAPDETVADAIEAVMVQQPKAQR
jgi:hypothetical protein